MGSEYSSSITQAVAALRSGRPILLYDFEDRENETDVIFHGAEIDFHKVAYLRRRAGAPISIFAPIEFGQKIGIPRITELAEAVRELYPGFYVLSTGRTGKDCNQSITLDHRNSATGSSDIDASMVACRLTHFVNQVDRLGDEELLRAFAAEFKMPGHVPIVLSSRGLLRTRQGHVELALAVCELAGVIPVVVGSELINPATGRSMDRAEAIAFGQSEGVVFIEAPQVISAWESGI